MFDCTTTTMKGHFSVTFTSLLYSMWEMSRSLWRNFFLLLLHPVEQGRATGRAGQGRQGVQLNACVCVCAEKSLPHPFPFLSFCCAECLANIWAPALTQPTLKKKPFQFFSRSESKLQREVVFLTASIAVKASCRRYRCRPCCLCS